MKQILFFAYFFCLFTGIGLLIRPWLRLSLKESRFLTALLGAAFAVPFSNIAYYYGLTTHLIFWILSVLAFCGLVAHFWRVRPRLLRGFRKSALFHLMWLASAALLVAPRLAGGSQFAVYQANRWDTFGYLESASSYARYPFAFVEKAGLSDQLADPLLVQGQIQMYVRPAIHMFFGVASHLFPGDAWDLHYTFLTLFVFLSIPAAGFLLSSLFGMRSFAAWIAGACFALGFWGQYALDINAWSQVASAGILVTLTALILRPRSLRLTPRGTALVALFTAGAVYTYPEAFLVVTACSGAAAAAAALLLRSPRRLLLPAAGGLAGLALALFFYKGTLQFILTQLLYSKTSAVDWWKVYQAFFLGRDLIDFDPSLLKKGFPEMLSMMPARSILYGISDFVSGIFGLYFSTPTENAARSWKLASRILLSGLCVTLCLAVFASLRSAYGRLQRRPAAIAVPLFLAFGAGVVGLLVFRHSYWAAGKALSYFSPFFVAFLAWPIAARQRKFYFAAAVVYACLSIAAGVSRIAAARHANGIHYSYPYPIVDNDIKTGHDWNLHRFDAAVRDCRVVRIETNDSWFERYVMLYLTAQEKQYVTDRPVDKLFGQSDTKMGRMPAKIPDCILTEAGIDRIPANRAGTP